MGSAKWTYREEERLKQLVKLGLNPQQIAVQINAEFKHDRTELAVRRKLFQINKFANEVANSNVREKRCLTCRRNFFTDQPRQIHICDGCKGTEIYRGAA